MLDGNPSVTAAFGALGGLAGGTIDAVAGQRADICWNFLENEVLEQGLAVKKNILALVKEIDAISHDLNV